MKPTMGRMVVFRAANGAGAPGTPREDPAVITRVHGADDYPAVNLIVFPDTGHPYPMTSVPHVSQVAADGMAWRWPEIG